LTLALAAGGCRQREAPPPSPEAPVIPVCRPIAREITDYVYYTGRTDAVSTAEIRARVTGYLIQMPFREGAEIKAGDLLFEVDPRPYQAKYDSARAILDQKDAAYRLARAENARSKAIDRNVPGSISPEALQQSQTSENQSLADYNSAKANVDSAKLDLDFTKVTSPIDGQVSRYLYTIGNLVNQDQTLLTTVVSVDPMYAYFDMDERTIIKIRKLINEGKIKPRGENNEIPVFMALEGDEGYPHKGSINFSNNTVTISTGTLTVRGVFANPKPANGLRLLTPGMFVRIQLPVGPAHPALLLSDRSIGSDQGMKFVYVIDAQKKVQYRRIKPGALQDDGLRAIDEGLKPDDQVVVGGLQQLRPRMEVQTEDSTMPGLDEPAQKVEPPAKKAEPAKS
jgi:multidrug efflux system membrane fusion protein